MEAASDPTRPAPGGCDGWQCMPREFWDVIRGGDVCGGAERRYGRGIQRRLRGDRSCLDLYYEICVVVLKIARVAPT